MEYAKKYEPLRPMGKMTHALNSAEAVISQLAQAKSAEDVSKALEIFAGLFGLSMTGHVTVLGNNPEHTISFTADPKLNNYFHDYNELNCIDIDGILWQVQHGTLPIPWGFSEQRAVLDKREVPLFSLADDYGIFRGVMVPIHGPQGFSALGTASDEDEAGFRKRAPEFGMIAQLVGVYLHDAVHRVCLSPAVQNTPKLTRRERECLTWVATGKTAWEISQILSVAEATVIFHVENAKKKLGARALPQATARAVALGLITV
jgi:LuxR family transcriptional regulator, activator of conjugal transfer of Ti plasmids